MIAQTGYYPISAVSELTGVNAVTLRAWERRYGLIKPKRTPKGHRLYAPADVELIRQVLHLVEQGVPISHVRVALAPQADQAQISGLADVWAAYLDEMVAAIGRFDEVKLDEVYQAVMGLYPVNVVTDQLLMPLLEILGDRWEKAEDGIAQEHFFAVYIRNKLGARFHHRRHHARGPRLLIACFPGERHEVGLLLLALAAHDRGYGVIMLGADIPLEQLFYVEKSTRIDAVVLSSYVEPSTQILSDALPKLVETVGVPVFVGGQAAARNRDAIAHTGAHAVGADLAAGMGLIGDILAGLSNA